MLVGVGSLHPRLFGIVERRENIFVYGEYATGKSHLALSIAEAAASVHSESCIVLTEPGSALLVREYPPEGRVLAAIATSIEEQTAYVLRCLRRRLYTIVDTINAYCDPTSHRVMRYIALQSALLRASHTGSAVFGQVRGEPAYPACWQSIVYWFDVVAQTSRLRDNYVLNILRPDRSRLLFKLEKGRTKWI